MSNNPYLVYKLISIFIKCRYKQLEIVVMDEMSLVGARMFNVIDNRLRSIKHIQNNVFGGVDVIMTNDFYQTPLVKNSWIFQNIKDNVNALTPKFWQTYVQCYELNKVILQSNMVYIQTFNKFRIVTKNTKDIEFINLICN